MSWDLSFEESQVGESPGSESRIGFRGTRFSISPAGDLFLSDYGRQKSNHSEANSYVGKVRQIMGLRWSGRLRIRYGGDTYCTSERGWTYVGKTILGSTEKFSGYILRSNTNPGVSTAFPRLYTGPHNHGQVGERWTIPARSFARRQMKIGNVGMRISRGDWNWSSSAHSDFIERMRSTFRLEDFLRFYITCYGEIVRPIQGKFWGDAYKIDIQRQFDELAKHAPRAANSAKYRIENRAPDTDPTLYFVCGHVDDLMGGQIPVPDESDPRTRGLNQDLKRWG